MQESIKLIFSGGKTVERGSQGLSEEEKKVKRARRKALGSWFYSRYVDDCFVICATQAKVDQEALVIDQSAYHARRLRFKALKGTIFSKR
ncbi:hypothetical protein RB195_022708 [Necator americanus]|uniref:Uncharacterized protein n=1 Tax=Necator americanus TaxID=51031 RepID=A0ABR1EGC2_NECAM